MFIPQSFLGNTVEETVDTKKGGNFLGREFLMFFKSLKVKQSMYQWDLKPKTRVPRTVFV